LFCYHLLIVIGVEVAVFVSGPTPFYISLDFVS
jgi:hypothetical protein